MQDAEGTPRGCRFYPRCPHGMDVCLEKQPPLIQVEGEHAVACYLYEDGVEERVKRSEK